MPRKVPGTAGLYRIDASYLFTDDGGSETADFGPFDPEGSYTDTSAAAGESYDYQLLDAYSGDVLYTASCSIPDEGADDPWINLSGSATGNSINLHWNTNILDGVFSLQRSTDGDNWGEITGSATGNDFSDSGLDFNANYIYHLTPNDGGQGESNYLSIVTGPQGLQWLSASAHSSSSIDLSWTGPDEGDALALYRGTTADFELDAAHLIAQGLASASGSFTDTGLTPGTQYFYKAVNWNSAGSPSVNTITAITLNAGTVTSLPLTAVAGKPANAIVGTFEPSRVNTIVDDYTASIDWSDGSTESAQLLDNGDGTFAALSATPSQRPQTTQAC